MGYHYVTFLAVTPAAISIPTPEKERTSWSVLQLRAPLR
jgi:hypothetical protein